MGIDTRLKTGDVQAIPFFEHALELDPNFALAARLGAIYSNLRDLERAQKYLKQAFARADSLSEPERLYIKSSTYHFVVSGRLDDVVATYRLWIATYPDDWVPHNNLSTAYARLNQLDNALEEAQAAVRLAPNSVVAYQQLTRAQLALDRLSDAKDVIKDASAKGLDSSVMHQLALRPGVHRPGYRRDGEHLRAAASRADGYLVVTEAARAAFATGVVDGSRALYAQEQSTDPRRAHARRRRQPDRGAGAGRRADRRLDSRSRSWRRRRRLSREGPETMRTAWIAAGVLGLAARRPRSSRTPFSRKSLRRPTSSKRRCRCCGRRSRSPGARLAPGRWRF